MFIAFLKFLMRTFQRLVVIAGLIALGIWLFYIGREHQVFLDNKNFGDIKAFEQINVSINGGEEIELMSRERNVAKVVGGKFQIQVKIFDENGEVIKPDFETVNLAKTITIDIRSKDIMINLPAFVSNNDGFIVPAPR